ncbi:hypothetical protein LTR78_009571 [Recurvomyces mirabilis]|uniref:Glycosyltransferase family 28 N-terminal domain-containing protein n=1 Tax=Recurvomyces mirabilis TaxID=574656 RepID=A0AAE0TNG0_9PEZI|nr:hypothetical protein LTR78_009571 [Recurvomyces mirabilis]KAK5149974.1 hypothetical protein LTS14_010446 [Recurvomyces mirabilis]
MAQRLQRTTPAGLEPEPLISQDPSLSTTDLVTPEGNDDELPPPAYGDIYGEIRSEKNGMGTMAHVTDDGRVNIRVNQLNRRLSQVFTPALRQQLKVDLDSPAPAPYIHPSLGGLEGIPPPPPLNIVIQVVGSRGDVQPFIALGKVLKNTYGHRVRLATHPTFKKFVEEHDLEFFSIGGDPSQLMAFMVKNPGLMPGFKTMASGDVGRRRRDIAEYIQGCWRSCYKAGNELGESQDNDDSATTQARPFVADCIIANPPSFAHIHCAEKLGIPLHIMFTMPYSPTQAFSHPLANIQSSNADPQMVNYISYAMIELLSWQGLGDIINRFRIRCLGLEPVSMVWGPGMLQRLRIPHTYCWSPALIPKPTDWGSHITISGFFNLTAPSYTPPPDLQAFLDAGPAPVYIGFGSIVLDDAKAMTNIILEAIKSSGQRLLLSRGWSGLGGDHVSSNVFMVDDVPHDWLFKHVSCVVHHGGAGTTAAGITAGRPTIVVPFFGDQPFWGSMVARAGAGPEPIPHRRLTSRNLADAINFCLQPETLERAKSMANNIATERGSEIGAQSFHQYLEVDRIRCTLAPLRAAAWRIRRTNMRLSAFAACTLANAGLLDFRDLKLFRAQEYTTDEGPWDPVSGGFTAATSAFASMFMGLMETPTETYKAVRQPSRTSRAPSQESVQPPTSGSSQDAMTHSPVSPAQSSLDAHSSFQRLESQRSLSKSSVLSDETVSTRSKNLGSSESSSSQPVKQEKSSVGKEYDMLSKGTPHGSKGAGRFAKALLLSPMDLSVSITKGFHNAPKMLGDTVRPQYRVYDLKSGGQAAMKEFGYGWYDGVTGMVTQPWQGAKKEGALGFAKGVGRGVGGIIAKPGAGMLGLLGHTMKGIQKEVQKQFGSNAHNYIIASRTTQGYEEWIQSSDDEKEDVIERWKLIQKYLKKGRRHEEHMRDILEVHQSQGKKGKESRQGSERTSSFAPTTSSETSTSDGQGVIVEIDSRRSSNQSLAAAEINETIRRLVPNTTPSSTPEKSITELESHPDAPRTARRRPVPAKKSTGLQSPDGYEPEPLGGSQDSPLHELEASQHTTASVDTAQGSPVVSVQAMQSSQQSQRTTEQRVSDSDWDSNSDMALNDQEDDEFDQAVRRSEKVTESIGAPDALSASTGQLPAYDPGHLEGMTQTEFEARQRARPAEKTAQERTEEEIVLEYIKKQSLLELQHRSKTVAGPIRNEDDEDLQEALTLSMRGHGHDAE